MYTQYEQAYEKVHRKELENQKHYFVGTHIQYIYVFKDIKMTERYTLMSILCYVYFYHQKAN